MAAAHVRSDPPLSGGCGYQFGYQYRHPSTRVHRPDYSPSGHPAFGLHRNPRGTYLHLLERCGLRVERESAAGVVAGRLSRPLSVNPPLCGCRGLIRLGVIAGG